MSNTYYRRRNPFAMAAVRRGMGLVIPPVAAAFGISCADITSRGRKSPRISRARQVVMAHLSRMGHTHGDISAAFHCGPSSVSYAIYRVTR